jgi:hypothetical protein
MRTTVNIEDEVLETAKAFAAARKVSLGEVISDLLKRGLNAPIGTRRDPLTGLLVFDTPPDAPKITMEDVQRAQDALDAEEAADAAMFFRKP